MKNREQMIQRSGHQQNSHSLGLIQENCYHHPIHGELYTERTVHRHLNLSTNTGTLEVRQEDTRLCDTRRCTPSHLGSIAAKNTKLT